MQPIKTVTVAPALTPLPLEVQVIDGAATVTLEQVTPLNLTSEGLLAAIPLKENPVADGDAVLLPVPGKVSTIVPPPGTAVLVVKLMVCMAVTFTIKASGAW